MNRLVQISKRRGQIDRVKKGETPVLELLLSEREYVVGVSLEPIVQYGKAFERKTQDWTWTAYVVTPL